MQVGSSLILFRESGCYSVNEIVSNCVGFWIFPETDYNFSSSFGVSLYIYKPYQLHVSYQHVVVDCAYCEKLHLRQFLGWHCPLLQSCISTR